MCCQCSFNVGMAASELVNFMCRVYNEPMRQDNVYKGSKAEARFISDCIEYGFNIAMPITRTHYDFLVDTTNEVYKVQVKSVSKIDRSSRGEKVKCMLTHGTKKGKRFYTKKHCDFIVLWVEPLKIWYLFPISEVQGKLSISLFPTVKDSSSKYEKFRNNWSVF